MDMRYRGIVPGIFWCNMIPKYPSTFHWPWSRTVHRDDSRHENPEFFLNKEVIVTEKIDGGNTGLNEGEAYSRSTGQVAMHGWFALVKKYHAHKTIGSPYYYYGEDIYGIHSIEYDAVREDKTFRLFAVRDEDYFFSWDEIIEQGLLLDFNVVPIKFRGVFRTVKEITKFFETELTKGSELGGKCEGFVMRIADRFKVEDFGLSVCKYVRKNHVQTDAHWTKNWKPCKLIKIGE